MASEKTQPEPLWVQLLKSSQKFAQLAMQDYLDNEMGSYFVHAGTALEQLVKSYLASMSPSLIADGRSFDSLLHACGKGRHARIRSNRARTITIGEALDRCSQMLPGVNQLREDLRPLVDARNGAIHAGAVDESEKLTMLVPYLRASRVLLGEEGHEEAVYWGEYKSVVDIRLSQQTEAAAAHAKEAVVAARLWFEQKYGHLAEEARDIVLTAVEQSYSKDRYENQWVDCPACQTPAMASGFTDAEWEADWEMDEEGEPYASGGYPVVTFYPSHFECHACGLELNGEEEIAAAEIAKSWQLEDVDPRDFVDEDEFEHW